MSGIQFDPSLYTIGNQEYPRAVEIIREVVVKCPHDIEAHVLLGDLLRGAARSKVVAGAGGSGRQREVHGAPAV
jgi:hypothetical protein